MQFLLFVICDTFFVVVVVVMDVFSWVVMWLFVRYISSYKFKP